LLTSGLDMVRVSSYGRSSLTYRSIAVKPYATADQHSACHSTAVRLKEVLRCLGNLNAQQNCNALLASCNHLQASDAKVPAVRLLITAPTACKQT